MYYVQCSLYNVHCTYCTCILKISSMIIVPHCCVCIMHLAYDLYSSEYNACCTLSQGLYSLIIVNTGLPELIWSADKISSNYKNSILIRYVLFLEKKKLFIIRVNQVDINELHRLKEVSSMLFFEFFKVFYRLWCGWGHICVLLNLFLLYVCLNQIPV